MKGKTAIITGSARGIGYGTATCLARKGANVVIADMDAGAAAKAAEALSRDTGAKTIGVKCDVTVRTQVEAMIAEAKKRFGGIDILVNNAGICPFVEVMDMSEEMFKRTIDVNLTGAFHCTQLAGRLMIEQGRGGGGVFITSLAVNVTASAQADYAASKAGLHMLMKSFAIVLGKHGITCNAIAPGMILTDMTRSHWEQPEPAAFIKTRVPVGRIGTPEDIGNAVALLCAEEAAYINGVGIIVDGGHQAVCV
jgi:NAD(P)-dependent dehydrogenase (short-subunit alcohol dehydrogenase family)